MTRLILALLTALFAVGAPLAAQAQAAPSPVASAQQQVSLTAPDGRQIDVTVWPAAEERGVVVFSHGFQGSPAPYDRVLAAWAAHGFTVVAPLHTDSLRHSQRADYDPAANFTTRIVDLAVVRGFVKASHPGMPIIAAGHSFGSLMSLIEAGASTVAGPQGDPDVRGVIAFSSAGNLQGVATAASWGTLSAPLLMITGDQDLVPGYVSNWADHRSPFDASPPGDRMLMVFEGGDHALVRNADDVDFALIIAATEAFLDAYGTGNAEALAELRALASADGVAIEHR